LGAEHLISYKFHEGPSWNFKTFVIK